MQYRVLLTALALSLAACSPATGGEAKTSKRGKDALGAEALPRTGQDNEAIFAGGCFWCVESAFEEVDGVLEATSGYTAGHMERPTYYQVGSGMTGHTEAVHILYDPNKVSYAKLLEVFWHNIDPTQANGQFCDRGSQYRSGIFYLNEGQKAAAEKSLAKLKESPPFKGEIVTEIAQGEAFYPAEDYHQDFYKKNPVRYLSYRTGCGRDARLKELWGEAAGH